MAWGSLLNAIPNGRYSNISEDLSIIHVNRHALFDPLREIIGVLQEHSSTLTVKQTTIQQQLDALVYENVTSVDI
jgi:hypothetical protein